MTSLTQNLARHDTTKTQSFEVSFATIGNNFAITILQIAFSLYLTQTIMKLN